MRKRLSIEEDIKTNHINLNKFLNDFISNVCNKNKNKNKIILDLTNQLVQYNNSKENLIWISFYNRCKYEFLLLNENYFWNSLNRYNLILNVFTDIDSTSPFICLIENIKILNKIIYCDLTALKEYHMHNLFKSFIK